MYDNSIDNNNIETFKIIVSFLYIKLLRNKFKKGFKSIYEI